MNFQNVLFLKGKMINDKLDKENIIMIRYCVTCFEERQIFCLKIVLLNWSFVLM